MYTDILKYATLQQLDPTKSNDFNKIYTFIKSRYPNGNINEFICSLPLFNTFALKSKGVEYDFNFRDLAVIMISYLSRSLKISFLLPEDSINEKKHHTSAISVVNGFFKYKLATETNSYKADEQYKRFLDETILHLGTTSKVHLLNCLMSVADKDEIKNFCKLNKKNNYFGRDLSFDFFLNFVTKDIFKNTYEFTNLTEKLCDYLKDGFNSELSSVKALVVEQFLKAMEQEIQNEKIYKDEVSFIAFLNESNSFIKKIYSFNNSNYKNQYSSGWENLIYTFYYQVSYTVNYLNKGLKNLYIVKNTAEYLRYLHSQRSSRVLENNLLNISFELYKPIAKLSIDELKKVKTYVDVNALEIWNLDKTDIVESIKNEFDLNQICQAKVFISNELEAINLKSNNYSCTLCYLYVLLERQIVLIKEKDEKG